MSRATVTEPAGEIDVIHETDVLVVGSGPGVLAAALSLGSNRELDRVHMAAVQAELHRQGVRYR